MSGLARVPPLVGDLELSTAEIVQGSLLDHGLKPVDGLLEEGTPDVHPSVIEEID